VGVIATVGYMAFQIRQNTRAIQGSTEQSLMNAEMSLYALLAEHAGVYRRGCVSVVELEPDEEAQFEHLVMAFMSQLYGAFVQYQRKLIPKSVWTAYFLDFSNYAEMPGFQSVWTKFETSYPKEFCQCLKHFHESRATK
jgi:hypothetical protein